MMKRLQIMIEEELDEALGREARKEGTSKAALIRGYVAGERETAAAARGGSALGHGRHGQGLSDDSMSVNDVVYPR